jgi:hypothetical protein
MLSDREFWLIVRRALLMICQAIEKKYLKPENITSGDTQITVSYSPTLADGD